MQKKEVDISIIIVNYKVRKELLSCITSIYKTGKSLDFEIIVVDNDEVKTLKDPLHKKFSKAIYIPSKENVGWGHGINIGSKYARGKYLYLLNPDTILLPNALQVVYEHAKSNAKLGVIASRLVDFDKKPYYPLGSKMLTPLRAIVSYTFLENIFPFSIIAKDFFSEEKKGDITNIEIAPLTASLIKKSVFASIGGFDKNFFLYFEEYDFGKRIKDKNYISVICDQSLVMHAVGSSTKKRLDSNQFFKRSRRLYFKKHFGTIPSFFLEKVFSIKSA